MEGFDWSQIALVIVCVLVGAAGPVLYYWRAGRAKDIVGAFADAVTFALAADQLVRSGQMKPEERFDYVMDRMGEVHPKLSFDLLRAVIEGAVGANKQSASPISLVLPDA